MGCPLIVRYPARAYPQPRYRWYRLEANNATRRILCETTDPEFHLSDAASSADAGNYEVIVYSPALPEQNQKICFKVVVDCPTNDDKNNNVASNLR